MTTSTLPCPTCGRTPAQGCWTVSGHAPLKVPHTRQVDQTRGWDAGYPAGAASRDAEVKGLKDSLALTSVQYQAAQTTIAALRAQVAELEDPPTPAPVPTPLPGPVDTTDRKTGPGFVRYEDTYVAGDNLQQTLARVTGGRVLTFPEDAFAIPPNFVNGDRMGVVLGHQSYAPGCLGISGSLRGGKPVTIFSMASTTTNPASIAAGQPNPYYLMAGMQTSKAPSKIKVEFSNFWLRSELTSDHQGLRLINAGTGSLVENIRTTGIKGSDKVPPGETGSLSIYLCDGVTINDSEFDGRNQAGTRVSSSLAMVNSSTHITFNRTRFHHTRTGGGGIAWYKTSDSDVNDCTSEYIGSGPGKLSGYCFNHEESNNITYRNPVMVCDRKNVGTPQSGPLHMSLNADSAQGGIDNTLTVINPTWDDAGIGGGRLCIETWTLPTQVQHRAPDVYAADGKTRIPYYYISPFGTGVK